MVAKFIADRNSDYLVYKGKDFVYFGLTENISVLYSAIQKLLLGMNFRLKSYFKNLKIAKKDCQTFK